jgi:hypothetical protein
MIQKFALVTLLTLLIVLIIGWNTSTRYVEMQFLDDGVPLSGHTLDVIGGKEGMETESFEIASDGWVKLPTSYVGKKGVCAIRSGDKLVYEFLENGFNRGQTSVNFNLGAIQSNHSYRFLIFESQTRAKSLKSPKSSEQSGTGQPATRPVIESEGSDQPQSESEERSR